LKALPNRHLNACSCPSATLNPFFSMGFYLICDHPPILSSGTTLVYGVYCDPAYKTLPLAPAPSPPIALPRYSSPESENHFPIGMSQSAVAAHESTVRPNPQFCRE